MTAFLSSQLLPGEHSNTIWRIKDAAADIGVEELLKPETWAHAAFKFAQYDDVIVIPQGGPYRAHLIVMEAGKNFAKMKLVDVILLNAADATNELPDAANLEVKWNGPKDKYTVLRRSDKEKLKTGFAIKAEAEAWAKTHALAMA